MSPALTLHHFLIIGAVLFIIGMIGFLTRRNLIILFLCAEMMLQGVAINLCAFARYRGNVQGQAFVLFILTVAACEAGIALAMILMLYKSRRTLDVSVWQDLREPDQDPVVDDEPLPPAPKEAAMPHLVPSGKEPVHTRSETSHV
jgi:NADH-quinone oxidoreductase subunit K